MKTQTIGTTTKLKKVSEMDNGYRSIKKDDIRQEGDEVLIDQYFTRPFFRKIPSFCLGDKYKKFELTSNEYRRPIAQDEPHYSSDIKPVIDQLSRSEDYNVSRYLRSFCGPGMFDACINNQEDVALKAENERLRKALKRAVNDVEVFCDKSDEPEWTEQARQALNHD